MNTERREIYKWRPKFVQLLKIISWNYGKKKNLEWYKKSSSDEDEIRNQTINQNKNARGNKKKRLPY